ncbi:MAG TPA: HEAT repeat domain-containing protein, partial [Pirellulales bacterium]
TLRGNNSDARLAALKASFRVINSEGHQADPRAGELCSTLTNCLADADPEIRKQAVGVIMQINHPDVMPPLVAALRDSNADVRAAAANGLRYRLDTFHEYDDAKFVEPLTAALSDADKRVRTSAAEALGHIHSKSKSSAAPQLAKLLSDPEPEVVTAAIQALVTMGSAVAANPIATLLDHPKLRAQAAIALADMNDSRAIVVLREELANKNTNAIDALGLLNDRDSVEPLIKLLDDNNVDVFRSAAGALGTIGDPRAIKPMIQAARASEGWRQFGMPGGRSKPSNNPVIWPLAHLGFQAIEPLAEALKDPSQTVREVAACALYEMRYNSDTCDKEDLQPAAEALAAALTDPSESVRNYAAIALAHLGDSRAADTLINVVAAADQTELLYFNAGSYLSELHAPRTFEPLLRLLNDPRPEVRSTATRALIGFHDPQAIEPLVTLLSDPAPMVREAAARALGFNKAEQAVGVLFILLADGDASVRIAAAEALGRIGQAKAIEPLANLLDEQDVRLRAAAGVALVRLNDPRGLDAITICLNSGDSQKREMAVTTICFTFPKCEALAKPLAAALNDPSVRVRMYAAGALGRIGNHEAVDALLAKLDDRENIRAILEGLGESKDDRAFAPIAHHLDDADPQNRIWAAAALANFPAEKSAGPLLEHLNEPSPEARLAIIDALATIQAESAADQLKALANDSDPKIRSHAARALSRMKK